MTDQIHEIIDKCLQCGSCVKKCEFLTNHCNKSPVDLSEKFISSELKDNISALFTCNLCILCEEVCPENLNMKIFMLFPFTKYCLSLIFQNAQQHQMCSIFTMPVHHEGIT